MAAAGGGAGARPDALVPRGDERRLLRARRAGRSGGASRREGLDPLDVAILAEADLRHVFAPEGERLAVFPFTEERRRETGIWAAGPRCVVATKGAPELVLGSCAMDEAERAGWLERAASAAAAGRKPIACAFASLDRASWRGGEPVTQLAFAGLVSCEDPVRAGVAEAITACRDAGIHTVMLTGDHPATALSVARRIGLGGGAPRLVLGDDLETLTATPGALESVDVVARALPSQKLSLVRALQARGQQVAATGDGVNDVPALQAADVGIAMGERGTQSAREIAAVVLLDDDFRTIVGAIAEGRQLFENLRRAFTYLLFVHVPLVFTAAFVPLAGYPLLYLPIHIIWLELIIHPTALLAFQWSARTDQLVREPQPRGARFFSGRDWLVLLASGASATVAVTWGYLHALGERGEPEHARAMALVVLTVASALAAAVLNRLRGRTARVIAAATIGSTLLVVETPPLAALLHLAPLHADDLVRALFASLAACAPLVLGWRWRTRSAISLEDARGQGALRATAH